MTERAALVAAVEADPDNDLPRLAWADWLDDQGEPDRAELIRVQCEQHRRPNDDPLHGRLYVRSRKLLAGVRASSDLPASVRRQLNDYYLVRGVLTGVRVPARRFAELAPAVLRREPMVAAQLDLTDMDSRQFARTPAALHRLVASPELRVVGNVVCWDDQGAVPLRAVLDAPGLVGVRWAAVGAEAAVVRAVVESAAAGRLRRLTVVGRAQSPTGNPTAADVRLIAHLLAGCPKFASLTRLHLLDTTLRPAELRTLVRSPHLPAGMELYLFGPWRPSGRLVAQLSERFNGSAARPEDEP